MASNIPKPNVDPIEVHIHETFDRLVFCLNQRRMELVTKYHEIQARPTDRDQMEQELLAMKAETEQRIRMNLLRETQLNILAELEQKLEEVRAPQPDTRVKFLRDTVRLEKEIAGVGEIIEEELVAPQYDLMRRTVAVGEEGEAPGKLIFPEGVVIDENTGSIYVAEGVGTNRVSVFTETGNFLNSFSHQDMNSPCGIDIHKDNIYVTGDMSDTVCHFKMEQQIRHVATFGSGKGSSDEQFDHLRGLAVSIDGDVFVADLGNNRIKILDQSLRFKRHVTHQSLKKPRDIKLTRNEMYVLCGDSPCVHVLSHAGEMTRSLVTSGDGMQVSKGAYFFCFDAKQNLLISDWGASKVKIFSKDGTYLHTVGQQDQETGKLRPRGIALTKNLNLVIVSHINNFRLQIFSYK